jgi:hypothetical protein
MAEDTDNLVLRLLREIRATQDEHSERLDRMEARFQHMESSSRTLQGS